MSTASANTRDEVVLRAAPINLAQGIAFLAAGIVIQVLVPVELWNEVHASRNSPGMSPSQIGMCLFPAIFWLIGLGCLAVYFNFRVFLSEEGVSVRNWRGKLALRAAWSEIRSATRKMGRPGIWYCTLETHSQKLRLGNTNDDRAMLEYIKEHVGSRWV